jgi:cell division protein FtsI (penicillin-binding protein 3)
VTVVIDSPTAGGSYYGGSVSAPVFAEVAQEVLEYLGVPHDQPLKPKKDLKPLPEKEIADDAPENSNADLTAMFDDANNLPADDPLRNPNAAAAPQAADDKVAAASKAPAKDKPSGVTDLLPAKVLSAFKAGGGTSFSMPDSAAGETARLHGNPTPAAQTKSGNDVLVDASKRVAVPSFQGAGLRAAIERADAIGLRLKPVGSGLAREQVPAAGTMVPSGTEIVVRFTR